MPEPRTLTEEEIAAEKKAAVDEAIKAKDEELKKTQEELTKLKDKDMNFGKVRQSEEEKAKQITDLEAKVKDLEGRQVGDAKDRLLDALAGDNKELRDTITHHFDRIKDEAKTEKEIEAKMREAYLLATKKESPSVIKQNQSANRGGPNGAKPTDSIDPDVKAWAGEFNKHIRAKDKKISDEDLKNPDFQVKPGQSRDSNYTL